MSFFHGRIELKDTKNCFITLPSKWTVQNFRSNSFGLIIIKLIFLDDIKPDKFLYVTWNGSKNCTEDSIFLDRNFASKSNIIDNELILVQVIDDLSNRISPCVSCYLKPLSNDDHQLIEMNAEEIEYEFLNQIRMVTVAFLKNNEFNIFPLWLKSSPNVPIFVRIFRVEPTTTNKTGLIITRQTKIVIVPQNEIENDAAIVPPITMPSTSLKSVFGLFKSLVPNRENIFPITHSSSNDDPITDDDGDTMTMTKHHHTLFPIYRGKKLFLRVILAKEIDSNTTSIGFISRKHFENLGTQSSRFIVRLIKLDPSTSKTSDIVSIGYDMTTMSANEKFCTTFVDKYLKIYDHINDLNVLVMANDKCPDDSIMFSHSFIIQYSLSFLSYVILDSPDLRQINLVVEKNNDGIDCLNIPVARKIFIVPLLWSKLKSNEFHNELVKKSNNQILMYNGFLVADPKNDNEQYFIIKQQSPVPDFDVEIFKFLSTSFVVDPLLTEIIMQQVTAVNSSMTIHLNKLSKKRQIINDMVENYEKILTKPFAGRTATLQECIHFIHNSLNLNSITESGNVNLFTALLVTGSKGSGKTTLIERLLYDCFENHRIWSAKIQCSNIKGKRIESLQKSWSRLFTEAIHHQPSILVFEDLHQIAYDTGDGDDDDGGGGRNNVRSFDSNDESDRTKSTTPESFYCERISYLFFHLVDSLKKLKSSCTSFSRVTIIATAESSECLNRVLKKFPTFDQTIDLQPLNSGQRIEILNEIFNKKYKNLSYGECSTMTTSINIDMKYLSKITKNFPIQHLNNLIDMIIHSALVDNLMPKQMNDTKVIMINDVHVNQAITKWNNFQLTQKTDNLKLNTKRLFKDIGGMKRVKEMLSNLILMQIRHPNLHRYLPLKLPNSLLIYGMPGSGKTAIVEAIANESKVNFLNVKGPELLSKYIGNSEQSVRRIFRQAQAASPCILFFDEFDSLAPRRGHDSTGVTDRVVNQMLTLMDGLEERDRNIFIIAATSRPDLIDLALLRPGRFDQLIRCDLPDENERKEIFTIYGQKLSIDFNENINSSFNKIEKSMENFTGADIQALLYNAFLDATKQAMDDHQKSIIQQQNDNNNNSSKNNDKKIRIEWTNIQQAMKMTRPALSQQERNRFNRIYAKFEAELSGQRLPVNDDDLDGDPIKTAVTLA
ncbi:hypothetical protein HUG17_4288 [Dermatophagoides farinae]|uniref:Peroxisomal ATPase PEX1 n=1 Tax=Dermatophagoides farinae TaxID=6954 RepID=A0A9D4SG98_DERFA|nr:peroxisome biogenesis factor 1-like [Dermatophagoides farinae]KAH7641244.1 hypothetical protein HUG17_4288 [Dermatophagoides farinae]